MDSGEIGLQVIQSDMLEHADRGDLVKLAVAWVEVPVVLQSNLHLIRQACLYDPLLCQFALVFGQGHTQHPGAEFLCRAYRQCAPATTDVEQTLARLEHEFSQRVVKFGTLGRFQ